LEVPRSLQYSVSWQPSFIYGRSPGQQNSQGQVSMNVSPADVHLLEMTRFQSGLDCVTGSLP
jgi:hypothetical protein